MKTKKIIGILLICIFTASAAISGYLFFTQFRDAKNSAETFEDLAALIQDVEASQTERPVDTESGDVSQPSETESPASSQREAAALASSP